MVINDFSACCTAREIGYINEDDSSADVRYAARRKPLTIATQRPDQTDSINKLKKAGFVDVGYYPGHAGNIHLFVHGLVKPKGLTKPRARSK